MLRRIESIKNGEDVTLIGMTYTAYAMAVEDPLRGNLQRRARKRVSWEGFLTWSLGVQCQCTREKEALRDNVLSRTQRQLLICGRWISP